MSLRKRLSFKRVWNFNTVSSGQSGAHAPSHTLLLAHSLEWSRLSNSTPGFDSVSVSDK